MQMNRMSLGLALLLLWIGEVHAQRQQSELVGLWKAQQWFGPRARGSLLIEKAQSGWTADFAGQVLPVQVNGAELTFALPDSQGSFRGRVDRNRIVGHWIAPISRVNGTSYASPVRLTADGAYRWRGVVVPRDDTFTLFLMVQRRPTARSARSCAIRSATSACASTSRTWSAMATPCS